MLCCGAVCLRVVHRLWAPTQAPGVLRSLQTPHSKRRTRTWLWRMEGKGVVTRASLGLGSDHLVLCLILGWR